MAEEIINRVANSKLKVIDLEDFYPEGPRETIDISQWLFQGLVLREKEFRAAVAEYNWEHYTNTYVALTCSTDAIVPDWAYMLLSTVLQPYAYKVIIGGKEDLNILLYSEIISKLDLSEYADKPVVIKGCSNKPVPKNAYVLLTQRLKPIVKSIMYGEACSAVPLYKKRS